MSIFAVEYTYAANAELLAEHRPAHRAFLAGLHDEGVVAASGPLGTDGTSALIVLHAGTPEEALEVLEPDPFLKVGAIVERKACEWNVVVGEELFLTAREA